MSILNFSKFLILLPIIFLFIPSMYLPGSIPVYDIIIGLVLFCIFILSNKRKRLLNQLLGYSKRYKIVKYLYIYFFYVIISGAILILIGKYNFLYALYALLVLFVYNNVAWFLYPSLIFPKFLSIKTLIKYLLVGIYIICLYGVLIWLLDKLNINFLEHFHNLIVNRRVLQTGSSDVLYKNRILSVFEEPGYFGGFICINLPIIYSIILSKYKLLKNKYFNYILKKSYIPLIILTIILIQSPIWLIFSTITTLAYFKDSLLKSIKKYFYKLIIAVIFFVIIIVASLNYFDYSTSYLQRVVNVASNIDSMEKFIYIEPSLANRVINYTARFKVFLRNPVIGAGYKNTEYNVLSEFNTLPLTKETYDCIINSYSKNGFVHLNGSILWNTLSDTGIIGFILYYYFLYLLIKRCNKLIKYLPQCIESDFIKGVKKTYITIIIFSFYDIRPNFHYFWFLFGLTVCFNLFVQERLKYEKIMD